MPKYKTASESWQLTPETTNARRDGARVSMGSHGTEPEGVRHAVEGNAHRTLCNYVVSKLVVWPTDFFESGLEGNRCRECEALTELDEGSA